MQSSNFNQVQSYTNFLGENTIGTLTPIDGTSWFYVIEINEDEAFSELNDLMIILASSTILVSLVIFETALLFSSSLSDPINNLLIATKKIIQGDLNEFSEADKTTIFVTILYLTLF